MRSTISLSEELDRAVTELAEGMKTTKSRAIEILLRENPRVQEKIENPRRK